MIYLESIETATGKGNENDQNGISFRREKFRQHILQSTCVQFSYLLSRLESSSAGADLHYEKAILYGKVSTMYIHTYLFYTSNQKDAPMWFNIYTLPPFNIMKRQCIKRQTTMKCTVFEKYFFVSESFTKF